MVGTFPYFQGNEGRLLSFSQMIFTWFWLSLVSIDIHNSSLGLSYTLVRLCVWSEYFHNSTVSMEFFLLAVTSEILTNRLFGWNYFPWKTTFEGRKISSRKRSKFRQCTWEGWSLRKELCMTLNGKSSYQSTHGGWVACGQHPTLGVQMKEGVMFLHCKMTWCWFCLKRSVDFTITSPDIFTKCRYLLLFLVSPMWTRGSGQS